MGAGCEGLRKAEGERQGEGEADPAQAKKLPLTFYAPLPVTSSTSSCQPSGVSQTWGPQPYAVSRGLREGEERSGP